MQNDNLRNEEKAFAISHTNGAKRYQFEDEIMGEGLGFSATNENGVRSVNGSEGRGKSAKEDFYLGGRRGKFGRKRGGGSN